MKRVLFLAERASFPDGDVPPHGSGAHVAADLWGLEKNFDVLALFAESEGTAAEATATTHLRLLVRRVVPGRIRGVRQDLLLYWEDRRFTKRALARAASFHPDVIYERNEYFALTGRRLARALGIPHVLEINGLLDDDYKSFYRSLGEPAGAWLERLKVRRADAVVTVTPGLGRCVVERGADPDRIAAIPNTVDPALVAPEPKPVRREGTVVVGWIGHVMAWHSLDLLIRAAEGLVDRDVRFDIVGGGEGLDEVRREVEKRGLAAKFRFTGSVARIEAPAYVNAFDIGVLPGHFEFSFPVKLVEMGAIGLPVAAPNTRSLGELLEPGVEFEPFVPGDAASLRESIARLIDDPDRRGLIGAAFHRSVRDRFTWDASAEALRALIEDRVLAR